MKLKLSYKSILLFMLSFFTIFGGALASNEPAVTEDEAKEIATEAYIYFYPIVTMDITRKVTTNLPPGEKPGFGPMNSFSNMREFPDASFRAVVRPNFDTLYSSGWLDLTEEPMIISAPDTDGRYYLLPMLDMWTNVFAAPGKRTSGTQAGNWAVIPPNWKGELPKEMEIIQAPTDYVWIIGRTQTNGPSDYEFVHKIQDGYKITPLSQWGKSEVKPAEFKADPAVDMKTPPLDQVNNMPIDKFLSYGAELMAKNPPQVTDWSQLERFKKIGLEPDKPFDISKLEPNIRKAVEDSQKIALEAIEKEVRELAVPVNGWVYATEGIGTYGDAYTRRAAIAMAGLGANQPQDAIYPATFVDNKGNPLQGGKKYTLTFEKGQEPPVNAFWSLTLYDNEGFQVENAINRYSIGSRDKLQTNEDGSVTLYIQSESPGKDKESNWLPSAKSGNVNLILRLYAPKNEALTGKWTIPAVEIVD